MRYAEQGFELSVAWAAIDALGAALAAAHRAFYGFDLPGIAIEIVTLRVDAIGALRGVATLPPAGGDACTARIGSQRTRFASGERETPAFDRLRLGPEAAFAGPAILVQPDATTLVPPGWKASVLATGTLRLTLA